MLAESKQPYPEAQNILLMQEKFRRYLSDLDSEISKKVLLKIMDDLVKIEKPLKVIVLMKKKEKIKKNLFL